MWTFSWCEFGKKWWPGDTFETREGAIAAGTNEAKKDGRTSFYIGRVVSVGLPAVDARLVLDQIGEQMYGEFGDVAENYLVNVPEDHVQVLETLLTRAFEKWANRYGYMPDWQTVVDEERIEVK